MEHTDEKHGGPKNTQNNERPDSKVPDDSTKDNGQGGEATDKTSTEEDRIDKTEEQARKTSAEDDKTGSVEGNSEKTEGNTEREETRVDKDKTGKAGSTTENKEEGKTQESSEKASEEDNKLGKTEESTEKTIVEDDKAEDTEESTEETRATDDKTEQTKENAEKTRAGDDKTDQTDETNERQELLSKGIADLQERRAALIEKHLKDGVQESVKFGSADNDLGTMLSGHMSVMFIINNLRTAVESRSRRKEQLKKKQAKLESEVGELRAVLDDKDRVIKEKEEDLQKLQTNKDEAEESKDGESQTDFDPSLESVDPVSQEHDQIETLKSDIEDKKLQRALLYEQAACMASDKPWKEHEVEFLDSLLNAVKDKPEDKEINGKKKSVMTWTLLSEYRKAEHELDVLKYKDGVLEQENEELERELAFLRKNGTGEDFDDESSDSDGEEEEEKDDDKRQLRDSIDDVIKAVKEAQKPKEEDSGRGSVNALTPHGPNEGRKKQLPPLRKKPQKPGWRY